MGRAYNNLGRREEALKALNESLSIWHEVDNGTGQWADDEQAGTGCATWGS
jgi:predicted aconitase with swiveling domain